RDLMLLAVGGGKQLLRLVPTNDLPRWEELAHNWGTETILAAIQILDHTLTRMKQVTHTRILAEVALVRVCHLENLSLITSYLSDLRSGKLPVPPLTPPSIPSTQQQSTPHRPLPSLTAPQKKNSLTDNIQAEPPVEETSKERHAESIAASLESSFLPYTRSGKPPSDLPETSPTYSDEEDPQNNADHPSPDSIQTQTATLESPSAPATASVTDDMSHPSPESPLSLRSGTLAPLTGNLESLWYDMGRQLEGLVASFVQQAHRVEQPQPSHLLVHFPENNKMALSRCETAENRQAIEAALIRLTGQAVAVAFTCSPEASPSAPIRRQMSPGGMRKQKMEMQNHPFVQHVMKAFGAHIVSTSRNR
ncbi:MAG: hypothetical protein MPJ24_01380, partial [Pirellulaceae bacterium]|nr:hypothetical protein [Pirellulaceae bacterium]